MSKVAFVVVALLCAGTALGQEYREGGELPPLSEKAMIPDIALPDKVAHEALRPESGISYKLTGNREIRPSSIRDDGERTYLQWSSWQALPTVLAVDRQGREEIINGYMRGEEFTLDRVYDRLVFRIDKAVAGARRVGSATQ